MTPETSDYVYQQIYGARIYDRIRTRVIVVHGEKLLLLEPLKPGDGWRLPGGGLEPDESLKDCGEREVYEETALHVEVTGVAFLREFVVPKYCTIIEGDERVGYSLEVYQYARLVGEPVEPHIELVVGGQAPHWIGLADVPGLPLWPKELKTLARLLAGGRSPKGAPVFVSRLEPPDAEEPPADIFEQDIAQPGRK